MFDGNTILQMLSAFFLSILMDSKNTEPEKIVVFFLCLFHTIFINLMDSSLSLNFLLKREYNMQINLLKLFFFTLG